MLTWIDGQAFAHHQHWECVAANYWSGGSCLHDKVMASAETLQLRFADAIATVFLLWPVSTAVHASNKQINRRAQDFWRYKIKKEPRPQPQKEYRGRGPIRHSWQWNEFWNSTGMPPF